MSRPGIKWPIVLVGGALVLPLVWVLAASFGNDPHYVPNGTVGDVAAPFELQDLNGRVWTLAELQGKPVVINFWSTWCGPCKIEHPVLQREPARYPDVVFLGAIYSDDPGAARRFLARSPLPYPSLVDPNGRLALDYGVSGVPETYFIDTKGLIVHKHVAPIDPGTLAACIEVARGSTDEKAAAICNPKRMKGGLSQWMGLSLLSIALSGVFARLWARRQSGWWA